MKTKNQTIDAAAIDGIQLQLQNAAEVVRLCAFAAEARRTLQAIEEVCDFKPELQDTLSRLVDAPRQWINHDDNLGLVLSEAATTLDKIRDKLDLNHGELENQPDPVKRVTRP